MTEQTTIFNGGNDALCVLLLWYSKHILMLKSSVTKCNMVRVAKTILCDTFHFGGHFHNLYLSERVYSYS